jgi:hypothetical protein
LPPEYCAIEIGAIIKNNKKRLVFFVSRNVYFIIV